MLRYFQYLLAHMVNAGVWIFAIAGIIHTPYQMVLADGQLGTMHIHGLLPVPTGSDAHFWLYLGLLVIWQVELSQFFHWCLHIDPRDIWAGASFGALVLGVNLFVPAVALQVALLDLLVLTVLSAGMGAIWFWWLGPLLHRWWSEWLRPMLRLPWWQAGEPGDSSDEHPIAE